MATTLQLESSDGVVFQVTREEARVSNLLSGCMEEADDDSVIPLHKVDAAVLRIVVDFMRCAVELGVPRIPKPVPLKTQSMGELVAAPFASLVDGLDIEDIKKVLVAADYMQMDGLIHLGAAKIALFIKGMEDERITQLLLPPPAAA